MWYVQVVIIAILAWWAMAILGLSVVKLGIREYFRQKRIYFLEMLKYSAEEIPKENK